MELGILLRLLMAHLLGDFLFQPQSWVKAKERKKEKAPQMYYHVLVVTVLTYVFLWDWSKWYIPLIVMGSHLAIDIWKSHRSNSFIYFLIDQLLHLSVILLIWAVIYFNNHAVTAWVIKYLNSSHFWTLILSYYLVIGPLGIAIGKATEKWNASPSESRTFLPRYAISPIPMESRVPRLVALCFSEFSLNQHTNCIHLFKASPISFTIN